MKKNRMVVRDFESEPAPCRRTDEPALLPFSLRYTALGGNIKAVQTSIWTPSGLYIYAQTERDSIFNQGGPHRKPFTVSCTRVPERPCLNSDSDLFCGLRRKTLLRKKLLHS